MAYKWPVDELFYGGAGGAGKGGVCHGIQWATDNLNPFTVDRYDSIIDLVPEHIRAMDSKVLMWDGQWKSFSEIKVGDRVMNPDGQMQTVLQVFERGEQETYTVSFEDGTSVDCDGDHLWGFWKAGENTRRKTCSGRKPIEDTSDPLNWNINYISRAMVRDTRWMYEEVSKGARLIIPIAAPLNFTQLHRGNISRAYLYGALIGDGSIQAHRFGGSGIRLSSADEWIIERCAAVLEKFCRYDYEGHSPDVVIKDRWVDQWARNTGLLGKYSHEKFLPNGYLKESLEFRWALAQGLFDTDGYASASRNEVSYCTVSPVLAEGVANLVRSLGFMAKVREKQGVCYTDGKAKEGRMAYIVAIEGNNRWRLFSLPRKVELAQASEPNLLVGKAIVGVEKKGKVYCRCIQVSNPNGLYVTDGYNVTHNSDLLLGLAGTAHKRALILRREFPRLRALIERSREIYNRIGSTRDKDSFNESLHLWRLTDDRTIQFGAVQYEKDWMKYQGQPHDLKGFDEITEFTETQFRSINIWNRTADPNQRCRVVCTGNPPTDADGEWVIDYWAPWLDPDYPDLAEPGDLVWFVRIKGVGEEPDKDLEIGRTLKTEVEEYMRRGEDIPRPFIVIGDKLLEARSRTFIPGRVEDNPALMATGYDKVLDALPEDLRTRFREGNFVRLKSGGLFDSQQVESLKTGTWESPKGGCKYLGGVFTDATSQSPILHIWDVSERPYKLIREHRVVGTLNEFVEDIAPILELYAPQTVAVMTNDGGLPVLESLATALPSINFKSVNVTGQGLLTLTSRLLLLVQQGGILFPESSLLTKELKTYKEVNGKRCSKADGSVIAAALSLSGVAALPGRRPFDVFDRKLHTVGTSSGLGYDPDSDIHLSFDFNHNPATAIAANQHKDALVVHHEWRLKNSNTFELAESVCTWLLDNGHKGKIYIHGDASGNKQTSNSRHTDWKIVWDALGSAGLRSRAIRKYPKRNPSVYDSTQAVNNLFMAERLYIIASQCPWLVLDLEQTRWDKNGTEYDKSNPALTHHVDELRYMVWDLFGYQNRNDGKPQRQTKPSGIAA